LWAPASAKVQLGEVEEIIQRRLEENQAGGARGGAVAEWVLLAWLDAGLLISSPYCPSMQISKAIT